MFIRKATEEDIPKIVDLLKLSLGESLMPKSEAYWRWKHINNPFGPSPVLLAVEDDKLIGVRAFMRWEWKKDQEIIKAVRAVDTATHPDYQGKGIFKKLTLQLVDECMQDSSGLVFNTPNKFSKPGYIKMGWQLSGVLPINISIKRPINILKTLVFRQKSDNVSGKKEVKIDFTNKLLSVSKEAYITNYSKEYLNWRYNDIPNINYQIIKKANSMVIYRFKHTSKVLELRITDVFGNLSEVKELLEEIYKNEEFDYMSISGLYKSYLPGILNRTLNSGPEVTIRKLSVPVDDFINYNQWCPSIGDLEVF